MNGLMGINDSQLFSPPRITMREDTAKKVSRNKAVTFVRATTFPKRVVNDCNRLPASIVEAPTLNTFKNRLDEHWRDLWYLAEVA